MRINDSGSIISCFLLVMAFLVPACSGETAVALVRSFKHDEACFTQGLFYYGNVLYESCGLYGKSSLRIIDPVTGDVIREKKIAKQYFTEGIAMVDEKIFMLTWKEKKVLVFDGKSLEHLVDLRIDTHTGQGWGLTYDAANKQLITSDGSDRIRFYTVPDNFMEGSANLQFVREITAKDIKGNSVGQLNELEYDDRGFIYTNVWYKDVVLKINAQTGTIVEHYDTSALYPRNKRSRTADCLNGIAINATDGTLLLTGKLWPKYYVTKLLPEKGLLSTVLSQQQQNL